MLPCASPRLAPLPLLVSGMPQLFQAFGLTIESELELRPGLRAAVSSDGVDVRFLLGKLPPGPDGVGEGDAVAWISPDLFQFHVEGVASFRVEAGKRILIDPAEGANPDDVRGLLLGMAVGALLHQRGLLPLHASAVAQDGLAHAFVGDSGAGKSTLVLALRRRGLTVLSDDVALAIAREADVLLCPGLQVVKLWQDALDHFGLDSRVLARDLSREEKFHLRLDGDPIPDPLPLRHVYVLERSDGDLVRIEPVRGQKAIALVRDHTYRSGFVHPMGRAADHLRQCGAVASRVRIFRFHRPWGKEAIEASVDVLVRHMAGR